VSESEKYPVSTGIYTEKTGKVCEHAFFFVEFPVLHPVRRRERMVVRDATP
jgi:hypothetical protein